MDEQTYVAPVEAAQNPGLTNGQKYAIVASISSVASLALGALVNLGIKFYRKRKAETVEEQGN